MLIYLDSSHCKDLYPNNVSSSFDIEMPDSLITREYQGGKGRWFLALVDISIPPIMTKLNKWDIVYVICEQVISCARGPIYSPIIRHVTAGEIKRHNFVRFPSLIHVPVVRSDLKKFSIRLTDSSGQLIKCLDQKEENTPNVDTSTKCTLELLWSTSDRRI